MCQEKETVSVEEEASAGGCAFRSLDELAEAFKQGPRRGRPAPLEENISDEERQPKRREGALRSLRDLQKDFWQRRCEAQAKVWRAPDVNESEGERVAVGGLDVEENFEAEAPGLGGPQLRSLEELAAEHARRAAGRRGGAAAEAGGRAEQGLATGTLRKLIDNKGFGFVAADGGAADIFLHCADVIATSDLVVGMRFKFETEVDAHTGKLRARRAVLLEEGDAAARRREGHVYTREEMLCAFAQLGLGRSKAKLVDASAVPAVADHAQDVGRRGRPAKREGKAKGDARRCPSSTTVPSEGPGDRSSVGALSERTASPPTEQAQHA